MGLITKLIRWVDDRMPAAEKVHADYLDPTGGAVRAAAAAAAAAENVSLLGAIPTAAQADVGALTATAIAAAVPAAAPAGGTGATEGAYDSAVNRDAMITTVNGLRTHAIEVDLDYEAILVDVAAVRTTLNGLLAKLRTAGIVTA